jgi:hypothetical protein
LESVWEVWECTTRDRDIVAMEMLKSEGKWLIVAQDWAFVCRCFISDVVEIVGRV